MDDQKINRALLDVYTKLYAQYGPQYWWPAEDPFEIIIGAILTQSTAWSNVEKAITNLKNAGTMSARALREIPEDNLAELIYPSGYYNAKARKIKAFAQWLGQQYDDNLDQLFKCNITELRKKLLGIYGIGEETADSIILYAAGKPVFVIDAYTRRIINSIGITSPNNSYGVYQSLFMDNLPSDSTLFNEYHALIVRHGKETCKKNPSCESCCLNKTGQTGAQRNKYPCSVYNG